MSTYAEARSYRPLSTGKMNSECHSHDLATTYAYDVETGIWKRRDFAGIAYSDGDEIEHRIDAIIRAATDLSVLSPELRGHCVDWATLYHFSPSRSNILRPFTPALRDADVLEIGAGCGAITRFLGEVGANTLALEGSVRRASIARARTRDLKNVQVVADDFSEFNTARRFDFVTLIGVLEYANLFSTAADPSRDVLTKIRGLLKPGGRLIIAIENQLGLKYFAGASEDHIGLPAYGLEGSYRRDQAQTFGKAALERKIRDSGFADVDLMLPFPDYKLPHSIVSSNGLQATDFDAVAFAWQNAGRDPQKPHYPNFSQELVWPQVFDNGLGADLANSFLWVARTENPGSEKPAPLAWHFSVTRKPEFCKQTKFERIADGRISVRVERLGPIVEPQSSDYVRFQPAPESDYHNGETLAQEFTAIAGERVLSPDRMVNFFRKYRGILLECLTRAGNDATVDASSGDFELPGEFLDAIPQNILRLPDDRWIYFDREWVATKPLSFSYLVFRSLVTLFDNVSAIGAPAQIPIRTWGDLLDHLFAALGLPNGPQARSALIERESELYDAVIGGSCRNALVQRMDMEIPFRRLLAETVGQLNAERQKLREYESTIGKLAAQIENNRAPLHELSRIARRPWRPLKNKLLVSALNFVSRFSPPLSSRTAERLRRSAAKRDIRRFLTEIDGANGVAIEAGKMKATITTPVQPIFITPANQSVLLDNVTVGLHVHVRDAEYLTNVIQAATALGGNIHLFLTVPDPLWTTELAGLSQTMRDRIKVELVRCDPRLPPLAALVLHYGARLVSFSIVGSISTPSATDDDTKRRATEEALGTLLLPSEDGLSGARTALELLTTGRASLVSAQQPQSRPIAADVIEAAKRRAEKFLTRAGIEIQKQTIRSISPALSMFWTKGDLIRHFTSQDLSQLLTAIDREDEIEHVFSILLLQLIEIPDRGHVELCRRDPGDFAPDFESQRDFRGTVSGSAPKVLCYYLPQFHPTPENDEWHGKGFTEWTKVRDSQPLFAGHRQQRQPHADIGYYLLDGTETLKRQAAMMHAAGIYGMIFYHYWFSGRLILEKPAQALLADPTVDMPFCFCWANENWTRRWDGTESEVLLKQEYSAEDARAFIRHLIPYLKDPRYIRYNGRPVIFVYRPALIPKGIRYVDIWREECAAHSLPQPLIVGTLKDGAHELRLRGMEAAVERVLHDWTDGQVSPIDETLAAYGSRPSGVLDYTQVTEFYRSRRPKADVPVIRSLLPCFDNTPRYGSRAHITHNVSVSAFEEWLRTLVRQAASNSGIARDFIVINAWNEWAETAMIEPDLFAGYAYLNAVGRVLSGRMAAPPTVDLQPETVIRVNLTFAEEMLAEARRSLAANSDLVERFTRGLLAAREGRRIIFKTEIPEFSNLNSSTLHDESGGVEILDVFGEVRRFFVPSRGLFERVAETLMAAKDEEVVPHWYGDGQEPMVAQTNCWARVSLDDVARAPLICSLGFRVFSAPRLVRLAHRTFAALLEADSRPDLIDVGTVVRIHRSGELSKLERALLCLCAQTDAAVSPIVMGQDMSQVQIAEINSLLQSLPWRIGVHPVFQNVESTHESPDLRAKLLKVGISVSKSRYLAFLDFDDLLFRNAYSRLQRMSRSSGKPIVFARVYRAFMPKDGRWFSWRDRQYESGGTFEAFIWDNFAPIHSYLIDRSTIDMATIELPDDQKYMEDYLMLLQIVRPDNVDWNGLNENTYVGDYIHTDDGGNTISMISETKRKEIARSPEYRKCQERISKQQRLACARR